MQKQLKLQVERVLDEADAYCDVIVQFKSERDKQLKQLLEAVVEAERNRAMLVDPAQLLPPQARAFDGGRGTRRLLREAGGSLMAQLALGRAPTAMKPLESAKQQSSFLKSHAVSSALSGVQGRLRGKAAETAKPSALSNIGAVRVKVQRDDLTAIVEEHLAQIEGVYTNARIRTPRLAQAADSSIASSTPYQHATWGVEQTKALSAWSAFGTRGQMQDSTPVRVAVLDTGVDATHPDLNGRVVDFAEFDSSGTLVSQGVANARDSDAHGTHVAGTIAGGNASGGWIGMAPEAELVCGLVLDGAVGGTLAQVIAGIDWAVGTGAQVINMSLGGLTFEPEVGTPYQRAIIDAMVRGSLVVAAIGNDGHQTTGAPGNDYFSLAVAAHDVSMRTAGFSGGRTHVLNQSDFINPNFLPLVYIKPDVSAPGVAVNSCVPGGNWESFNGTSMATPHVSGAAALLFAATSLASRPEGQRAFLARDLLTGGASDHGESGQDQRFGFGAINVLRSIDQALARGF